MASLTILEAEADLLPHLEGKSPSARGVALLEALIEIKSLRQDTCALLCKPCLLPVPPCAVCRGQTGSA